MEDKLLTIKQAAEFLKCSSGSLRNWEKKGKLVPHRHPMNNYRLYKREDIENLLKEIQGN
jgi:MerR family copper efflux transcriptional regulator